MNFGGNSKRHKITTIDQIHIIWNHVYSNIEFPNNRCYDILQIILRYQWLEDSLHLGKKVNEESYTIHLDSSQNPPKNSSNENSIKPTDVKESSDNQLHPHKKLKSSPKTSEGSSSEMKDKSLDEKVLFSFVSV